MARIALLIFLSLLTVSSSQAQFDQVDCTGFSDPSSCFNAVKRSEHQYNNRSHRTSIGYDHQRQGIRDYERYNPHTHYRQYSVCRKRHDRSNHTVRRGRDRSVNRFRGCPTFIFRTENNGLIAKVYNPLADITYPSSDQVQFDFCWVNREEVQFIVDLYDRRGNYIGWGVYETRSTETTTIRIEIGRNGKLYFRDRW